MGFAVELLLRDLVPLLKCFLIISGAIWSFQLRQKRQTYTVFKTQQHVANK